MILLTTTGIDDPYEEPQSPEVVLEAVRQDGAHVAPEDMALQLLTYLEGNGYLQGPKQ